VALMKRDWRSAHCQMRGMGTHGNVSRRTPTMESVQLATRWGRGRVLPGSFDRRGQSDHQHGIELHLGAIVGGEPMKGKAQPIESGSSLGRRLF
jgi:hypothetical protein